MIYYGLLLTFVLEYVRPGSYIPPLSILNSIVPLGVISLGLIAPSPVKAAEIAAGFNMRVLAVLLGLIVLSVATAGVTLYAFETFTAVFGYCLLFWVIARHVNTPARVRGLFKTLIFIHLLLAALTPEMFTDMSTRHYLTSGTFLADGNDYALSVNLTIPMCLFLLFGSRGAMSRTFYGAVLLALVVCVVVTQSRGGTLALAAVAFYYWLKTPRKAVTAGLTVAAVVVILAIAPPTYFTRMSSISDYENDGSAQGRITAWTAGTRMALSNPILGVGAGNFPANFTAFAPPGEDATRWKTAHSIYFLILGELGLPGLALLLTFIIGNLVLNRRMVGRLPRGSDAASVREHRLLLNCMSASTMAYAVAGAFLSATYYPHMFVIAGLTFASRRLVSLGAEATEAEVRVQTPAAVPSVVITGARPMRPRRRPEPDLVPQNGRFF